MQQPTQIVGVESVMQKYRKIYIWQCDNNQKYNTEEMAEIIGTSTQCLLGRYRNHGLDSNILFVRSSRYKNKKNPPDKKYQCECGDVVSHKGNKVMVAEVLDCGREEDKTRQTEKSRRGVRSYVCVCRIMDNGQVLTRSPKFIGDNWRHV